jgi:glycosyltransferase involved in cell wall biosynthesis
MNTLISIITVSLNSEATIKRTIESILNQSYNEIEYIIIDGNSTDNTLKIIESYKQKFKIRGFRYKWISEFDLGIYDAMNKGVSMASGELIGVIGSDDWYEPEGIKYVANFYKNVQSDYIHGNITTYSPLEKKYKSLKAGSEKDMIKRMSFYHIASFIRKEVYTKLEGYSLNYKICADYDLILRIIKNNFVISHVNENIANFSYGGISTTQVSKALKESHVVRVNNGYNKYLSAWYYCRALLIYRTKNILSAH